MKITREKLAYVWRLIDRLSVEKTNVKFHYLLHKNKRLIEPEIRALEEAQKLPPEHQIFEEKRLTLCKEYCERDESGTPKEDENRNFIIPEDIKPEFETKMAGLKDEYKEMLEMVTDNRKQFLMLLKEDVDINFAPIPLSVMPATLLGTDIDLLYEFIVED